MGRKRKPLPLFEQVEVMDAGSEGKAVARVDNTVIFVPFVVPGDIVDIQVVKKKRNHYEGKAVKIHNRSDKRTEPRCEHFGLCGGCKWQNMLYENQLEYKQKQVTDNFKRIGKFDMPEVLPIIPSKKQYFYRNKLEFTFSSRKWLIAEEFNGKPADNMNGLGFHLPGMFDRIIDVSNCYLQPAPSNDIRLALRNFCLEQNYSFYDVKKRKGFLRNLIIRTTTTAQVMVIVVFGENQPDEIKKILQFLSENFPEITSLFYTVNPKNNDTINDLNIELFYGQPYITEKMDDLQFRIGPLSFYQTNPEQAAQLYRKTIEFADLKGDETVYDLYCGTGTITNYLALQAYKAIGIEYVPSAIEDARINSQINEIRNTEFFVGDIAKTLNREFFDMHGRPDVVITDPPRAGMHPKVVEQLMVAAPRKIVYVSCNPATQARDIALMDTSFRVEKIQPVDMFPQTQHVENITQLIRRD